MKKLLFITLLGLLSFSTNAQSYKTAIGLRSGFFLGITGKFYTSNMNAIEGILATRWGGFLITGLYEFTQSFSEPGMNWYYGFGAHFGYWSGNQSKKPSWWVTEYDNGLVIVGADAIIGIEYTFKTAPINISLDWKPVLNFFEYSGLWGDSAALSIRFIIK